MTTKKELTCQLCGEIEKLYVLADNTPAKLEICLTCKNTISQTAPLTAQLSRCVEMLERIYEYGEVDDIPYEEIQALLDELKR